MLIWHSACRTVAWHDIAGVPFPPKTDTNKGQQALGHIDIHSYTKAPHPPPRGSRKRAHYQSRAHAKTPALRGRHPALPASKSLHQRPSAPHASDTQLLPHKCPAFASTQLCDHIYPPPHLSQCHAAVTTTGRHLAAAASIFRHMPHTVGCSRSVSRASAVNTTEPCSMPAHATADRAHRSDFGTCYAAGLTHIGPHPSSSRLM